MQQLFYIPTKLMGSLFPLVLMNRLSQNSIPSAEEALTNTKRYHGSENIDADLITLSICFNNLAIIDLSKSQYRKAYETAQTLLVRQERHVHLADLDPTLLEVGTCSCRQRCSDTHQYILDLL